MDTIHYPFRRTAYATFRVVMGVLSVLLSPLLTCVTGSFVVMGIYAMVAGAGLGTIPFDIREIFILLFLSSFVVMSILTGVMGSISIYMYSLTYEATLTPETFTYGPTGRSRVIHLSEIASISGQTRFWFGYDIPWIVTIQDVHNQKILMRIGSRFWKRYDLGVFEHQILLRDLLARLPATARIDQEVQHYTATGEYR